MKQLDYLDDRVAESMAYLSYYFDHAMEGATSPYLATAISALRDVALGGKHLRARLVHIAAGEATGPERQAAVIFGAAVDMLHASFLIHDDIIDEDPLRRGIPAVHHAVTEKTGSPRVGNAMGILTGDLGLMVTYQLLSASPLDDSLVRRATGMVAGYAAQTVSGELLDVSHLVNENIDIDSVRLSNHLKTSLYSFTAPLHLGSVAARRDNPDTLSAMSAVADPLGRAYQAADDIAGAVAPAEVTGKIQGGDLVAGRKTLLTMRLCDLSLDEAVGQVTAEGDAWLAKARGAVASPHLPEVTRAGLHDTIDRVERMLHAHRR